MSEMPVHDLEWTDEVLERFWSFYGEKVHTYFAESYGAAIVRKLAPRIPEGSVCIDYGCGSGGLTAALLAAGYRVGAADFSPKSIDQVARRFAGHANFLGAWNIVGGAPERIPPADAVFSVETIEHVTDRHIAAYFAAIARLLKPDGSAIFTTPNNEDIEAAKVFCPESGAVFHPMQHVRSFDPACIEALLRSHGFAPTATFVTDFALSFARNPKTWLADKGKRALGMGAPPPHLVAIARPYP